MRYKGSRNYRLPEPIYKMQLRFWASIREMIKGGAEMTYNDIGDPYFRKFGHRITKKKMLDRRGVDFDENGFAINK
tara:strand:- start:1045 stop:1272 length:228 start_codon:yes stop_codon:yes gene_type:complete